MKTTDTLTTFFEHHLWANLELFERCTELSSEQLTSSVPGTFGSIIETLEHIALSEQGYFSRISTGERLQRSDDAPHISMEEMLVSIRHTGTSLVEWATKVREDDVVIVDWDGTSRNVPKTVILTQVINHGTEHRAQVMVIMTHLGIEPPELDAWMYFDILDRH